MATASTHPCADSNGDDMMSLVAMADTDTGDTSTATTTKSTTTATKAIRSRRRSRKAQRKTVVDADGLTEQQRQFQARQQRQQLWQEQAAAKQRRRSVLQWRNDIHTHIRTDTMTDELWTHVVGTNEPVVRPAEALSDACFSGATNAVQYLLDMGVSPANMLRVAVDQPHIVQLLLGRFSWSQQELDDALFEEGHSTMATLEQLVTAGANVNYSREGYTVLHGVIGQLMWQPSDIRCLDYLVAAGARVDEGCVHACLCCPQNNEALLRLLRWGQVPTLQWLEWAAESAVDVGNDTTIRWLLAFDGQRLTDQTSALGHPVPTPEWQKYFESVLTKM